MASSPLRVALKRHATTARGAVNRVVHVQHDERAAVGDTLATWIAFIVTTAASGPNGPSDNR